LISLIPLLLFGSLGAAVVAGAATERPIVVQLGVHRFDRTSAGTIVAHADAKQVGWQLPNGDISGFGPQTFLVGKDRSIYLDDGLNNRLLVWRAGRPGSVARTVPLPFATADSEVALGPARSIYTTRTLGNGRDRTYRLVLDRQTAAGELIWERRLPTIGGEFCGALRPGPGGTLYCVGPRDTWIPVATPTGRPTSAAEQRRATGWPVRGGLRLVAHIFAPVGAGHSVRFALLDRRGSVVRSWRVYSRSAIAGARAVGVVGQEPVVLLDIQNLKRRPVAWDYVVLRLGRHGIVARVSLRHAVYGDNLLPDVRVGQDGRVYQLRSDPSVGVTIARY
jgi:hypothetical protein